MTKSWRTIRKASGYSTARRDPVLWNDNDGGCKGACDRVPHQNVTDLKLTGQCIDGECYDDVLFHNLDSYIDNLQQDGIIVLHTIGSHGPTYYNRYPAAFRKFTPTCDTNEIGAVPGSS